MTDGATLPTSSRPYLIARGIGLIAGLFGAIVAARLLGPDARGSLGLFVFSAALGAAALGIGLPTAVFNLTIREPLARGKTLVGARLIALLAGLLSAAILFALNQGPAENAFGGLPAPLVALAGGLAVAGTVLVQAYTMAAVARGATLLAAAGQSLPVVLAALGYVISLVVFGFGLGGAMMSYGLGLVASALLVGWAGPRPTATDGIKRGLGSTLRSLASNGARIAISDIAYVLSYRLDVLLVAALAGLEALGRYSLGVQLVEPLAVAGTALGMSILGVAAESAPAQDVPRTVGVAARVSVLVCLVGGALMTLGAVLLGGLLLGPGYGSVPAVMAILVPGVAAIAVSRVLSGAVIGHGGLGIGSVIASATVSANVVLNALLLPAYGELGAALASSVAYALSLGLWLRAWREHGGSLGLRDLVPRVGDGTLLLRALTGRGRGRLS